MQPQKSDISRIPSIGWARNTTGHTQKPAVVWPGRRKAAPKLPQPCLLEIADCAALVPDSAAMPFPRSAEPLAGSDACNNPNPTINSEQSGFFGISGI